jgi:hypothetical protein
MRPSPAAFTLVEVLLATVLGMMLSGVAITALIAAQKSVRATEQLAAQAMAIRTLQQPCLLSASRATPFEPQPFGSGILALAQVPAAVTTALPAPAATLAAPPLRIYPATVTTTRLVEAVGLLDTVTVTSVGTATASGGQGILTGKSYRVLGLERTISLPSLQSVAVADLANGQVSFHLSQAWRIPANGAYQFVTRNAYLEATTSLGTVVGGSGANLVFGRPFRFLVPVL